MPSDRAAKFLTRVNDAVKIVEDEVCNPGHRGRQSAIKLQLFMLDAIWDAFVAGFADISDSATRKKDLCQSLEKNIWPEIVKCSGLEAQNVYITMLDNQPNTSTSSEASVLLRKLQQRLRAPGCARVQLWDWRNNEPSELSRAHVWILIGRGSEREFQRIVTNVQEHGTRLIR